MAACTMRTQLLFALLILQGSASRVAHDQAEFNTSGPRVPRGKDLRKIQLEVLGHLRHHDSVLTRGLRVSDGASNSSGPPHTQLWSRDGKRRLFRSGGGAGGRAHKDTAVAPAERFRRIQRIIAQKEAAIDFSRKQMLLAIQARSNELQGLLYKRRFIHEQAAQDALVTTARGRRTVAPPQETAAAPAGEEMTVAPPEETAAVPAGPAVAVGEATLRVLSAGFSVVKTTGDGRCLFRSIMHCAKKLGMIGPKNHRDSDKFLANVLRVLVMQELRKRRGDERVKLALLDGLSLDEYIQEMSQPQSWGGELEILMASYVLSCPIWVWQPGEAVDEKRYAGKLVLVASYGDEFGGEAKAVHLRFSKKDSHYDAVVLDHEERLANL